jgi:hypothetical protein
MEKIEGIFTTTSLTVHGQTWLTKPAMLASQKIKKSLFYHLLKQGRIVSYQPFAGVAFHVYSLAPITEPESEVSR